MAGSAGSPVGSGGSTGGAQPSAGTGGTSPAGGTGTGGTPSTAGDGGLGGMPSAAGGTTSAGQGGTDAAGSAGTPAAGTGGQSEWWFSGPREPPLPNGSWPPPAIKLTEVVPGVTQPTAIVAPRADTTRLYVTEKWGRIRLIKNGVLQPEPALDIRDEVLEGGPQNGAELMNQGKRGLVGLAFHPNYEQNGRIFVMYVADQGQKGVYGTGANIYDDGDMTFAEYKRSASNPDIFDPEPVGGEPFLQFDKGNCDQCSQHNGGALEIDVDGFLWASTGDPPPYNNPGSQDLMNLNGKLLRFDISGDEVKPAGNYPGADPYVASIGIRNAYKFSVDRYRGDIYVGDVGENNWEEVTVEQYGQHKKDHGWPKKEGNHGFMGGCTGCLDPVHEYNHNGGAEGSGAANCIIGGYVYRGMALPALHGAYVYGDNGSGEVRAVQVVNGALMGQDHTFAIPKVYMGCFGEDAAGELYVCDYNNNKILRVDAQ
jgi:glucose/arabinose dehydrogenase